MVFVQVTAQTSDSLGVRTAMHQLGTGGSYTQDSGIVDETSNCTHFTVIGVDLTGNTSSTLYLPGDTHHIVGNRGFTENYVPNAFAYVAMKDGQSLPSPVAGRAVMAVDSVDGDLKIVFG